MLYEPILNPIPAETRSLAAQHVQSIRHRNHRPRLLPLQTRRTTICSFRLESGFWDGFMYCYGDRSAQKIDKPVQVAYSVGRI